MFLQLHLPVKIPLSIPDPTRVGHGLAPSRNLLRANPSNVQQDVSLSKSFPEAYTPQPRTLPPALQSALPSAFSIPLGNQMYNSNHPKIAPAIATIHQQLQSGAASDQVVLSNHLYLVGPTGTIISLVKASVSILAVSVQLPMLGI